MSFSLDKNRRKAALMNQSYLLQSVYQERSVVRAEVLQGRHRIQELVASHK